MPSPSGEFADDIPAEQSCVRPERQHVRAPDTPGDRAQALTEWATALLATAPAATERILLRALAIGADLLDREQYARIRSLVVTAIAQQPGRANDLADAALAAARSWAGISAADAAHHTVIAARIRYRGGRHESAGQLLSTALRGDALPYPPEEIAVLYELLGRCLQERHRHREAAQAFRAGAALIAADPRWAELHADLAAAADRCRPRNDVDPDPGAADRGQGRVDGEQDHPDHAQ